MSVQVYQLSTQDFRVTGHQRQSLNIKYGGNVLVFFKIQGCQGCAAFEPIFVQLAHEDRRATMAILDLTYNRDIVQMSRLTTTPISKVPHLILYVQGRPHARFKGDKTLPSLKEFITGALRALPQNQGTTVSQQQTFVPQQPLPPQNMYGGPQPQGVAYMPDSTPPKAAIAMAAHGGPAQAHPSMQQQCDPDDDECLMIPEQIIPHNMPWESDYKKLTGVI